MSTPDWQMAILTWGWLGMLVFAIGYPTVSPKWWKTLFGWAMESSEISIAVLVGLSLLAYWFSFVVPAPVGTVIIFAISATAWARAVAMFAAQFGQSKADDDVEH